MQTPETRREWQFSALEKSLSTFDALLQSTPPEALTTYRDGGGGWTVLEVLCHLRDFEAVYLERARLTLNEDFPPLPFPDQEAMVSERAYNRQAPAQALEEWRVTRGTLLALLKGIADEETWAREGNHPRRGGLSLNDHLLLMVWHDMNHIEQALRILAMRQTNSI